MVVLDALMLNTLDQTLEKEKRNILNLESATESEATSRHGHSP